MGEVHSYSAVAAAASNSSNCPDWDGGEGVGNLDCEGVGEERHDDAVVVVEEEMRIGYALHEVDCC